MRIAIIGAGVSGIVAAHTLERFGHETVVFEKSNEIGGVWALGYPGVRLQNTGAHYHLSEIPWPQPPDRHPTSGQIRDYLNMAVKKLGLDIRTGHEVKALVESGNEWMLEYENGTGRQQASFDFIVVAIGQYSESKHKPDIPGQESFRGEIITERDVHDLDVFNERRVAVVGFGKSAVDMAAFAVERAKRVYHVFRTPRWLIPFHVVGMHYSRLLFCRLGTGLMPCWVQPNRIQRFIHTKLRVPVRLAWHLISLVFRLQCRLRGLGKSREARAALKSVMPEHSLVGDLRSAAAMAPEPYFGYVAEEKILPRHAELDRFVASGLKLGDGSLIECELVVLSLGSESPRFPFFPEKYRSILEAENDGVQLYRHMLHPAIPNAAFAGFNHGFMHVPAAEVGMLWLAAWLDGDLVLPAAQQMQECIDSVRAWKRRHINYEPSRSCAVNTRFQQYIDVLLRDLGLSPYRKLPNVFAELFSQYGAGDYTGVLDEYRRSRKAGDPPRDVLPACT